MKNTYRFLLPLLFVLLVPALGYAQTDWVEVETLRPKTSVIVTSRTGAEIKGKISSVSAGQIKISSNSQIISVNRDDISTVHLTRRGLRLKRALIGAAVGAGVGFGVGGIITATTKSDPLAAAGGFLYGIPIGAAVGAATAGKKRGRLIYSN